MNKEKVKKFVKEHKKELLIGGAGVVIGCVLMKRRVGKHELEMLKELRSFGEDRNDTFGSAASAVSTAAEGARCMNAFVAKRDNKNKLADYAGFISDYYKNKNPEVTGMVVFTK